MPKYSSDAQLEWEKTRSTALTSDLIWKLDAYRAGLFFRHLSKPDVRELRRLRPGDDLPDQLAESSGSVPANIGEGYSRATRPDRLRFYGYALGSVRECIVWYEDARGDLSEDKIESQQQLLARIRALLLGMISQLRPGTDFEP